MSRAFLFSSLSALQEMLPTIMSQMGMTTDFSLAGEGGQRKGGARADQAGEGQLGTISEQAGDDDVPGKSITLSVFVQRLHFL